MTICPCQSGLSYSQCCQPLLENKQLAHTAEQLMRSRYSAFSLQNRSYLFKTWHKDFCPKYIDFQAGMNWIGLKIIAQENGQLEDHQDMVHFRAFFKYEGKLEVLEEVSHFSKVNGEWLYENGQQIASKIKISRNELCPCGSGKKYKRCCA